jgi:hypothetical protein
LTIQGIALLLCAAAFLAMWLTPQVATFLFALAVLVGLGLIVFFERAVKIES